MKKQVWAVSALVIGLAMVAGAKENRPQAEEQWEWILTPYFFLPAIDTDNTVAGQTVSTDMSVGDLLDNFDTRALALRAEGWKGEYGFVLDGSWTDLDGDFGPGDAINVQVSQWYIDALVGGRTVQSVGGGIPNWWDFTIGPRYNSLKQEIGLSGASLGGTETWVDVMIGSRAFWMLGQSQWLFMLRGDIGGFGWGSASDLSASATAGFGWLFSEHWSLDLGYRYCAPS